jgi:eukaryotic-like serine/threonine-protein kinase
VSQNYEYFGKYILLEKLASGGMAEVWLARTQGAGGIGKFVAIKKILPQFSDNPEFIQMFRDEAAIAMNLSHSNIVSIYEFGQEKHQLFLVLDYVEGRNLRQILNKMKPGSGTFSVDQIIYMVKEVASGLDHAHRSLNSATGKPLNITHRDMSPQNIMISFEGEVKIIDFGIAKAENQVENTKTGTLKGKFGYMSPEQAEGQPTDLRTDVFSLGIVLWELLANDRLFIANNEINTLRKIRECQVPSLTKINPNVHPELERIVMKALTRDRNLRYQTAAALHRDLNRYINRQFPDFSPHDFSVFIKTIFADEILDTRQKLIDYSKVPFPEQVGKQSFQGDKTIVTSFPQTTTAAPAPATSGAPPPPVVGASGTQASMLTKTETFSESGYDPAFEVSAPSKVLDESAIKKNFAKPMGATAVGPRPQSVEALFPENTAYRQRHGQRSVSSRKKSVKKSWGPLKFIGTVGALIAAYVVVTSLFPDAVDQVQKRTLQSVNDIVSAARQQPNSVQPAAEIAPSPASTVTAPAASPAVTTGPVRGLVVNSVPSGAEIFLNGKSTGESTPARISVPTDRPFGLTLRKARYIDYSRTNLFAAKLDQASFTATLQKALVAYVNIDVRPARNVRVSVNGVTLKETTMPITAYAIPAGQPVKIQAQNTLTGEVSQQTIELYPDERKTIVLRVDKGRNPASRR